MDDLNSFPRARKVNRRVFAWLKQNKEHPFCIFINYMDAHWPYRPTRKFRFLYNNKPLPVGKDVFSKEEKHLINFYDAEIRYLDHHLGELFEMLKELRLFDKTMIIIEADHGESFGEHVPANQHGAWLFNELIHVPLIIKFPGQKRSVLYRQPVSLADIYPTVLSSFGCPVPGNIQGRALEELNETSSRFIVAEGYDLDDQGRPVLRRCLIDLPFKLIQETQDSVMLFDILQDPAELNDLSGKEPAKAEELKRRLNEYITSLDSIKIDTGSQRISSYPETKEKLEALKALGYVK